MLEDVLIQHLSEVDGLVAAYLFGSRARGDGADSSDVDIALWMHHAPRTLDELMLELSADLQQRLGLPVDVVILNGAPSDLVHRVLRDGVMLVERNRSARIRLEILARNDYFDMLPVRNAYRYGRRSVRP